MSKSKSVMRAYSDSELQEMLAVAKRNHAENVRGGYNALAEKTKIALSVVLEEVEFREEEASKWDEWGNYIGPPDENPQEKKVPWWRSKKFWKKVYSL